jgi:TPR repeat protein
VDANHPTAVYQLGMMYMNGDEFLSPEKKDMGKAFKLLHRSAQLGYAPAFDHLNLAHMYFKAMV